MSGPYVVTVKRGEDLVSRCAVATLEEARGMGSAEVLRRAPGERQALVDSEYMDGDYSEIGPLPDGTVIEVEEVDWRELESIDRLFDGRPLIEWWNATHGVAP